VMVLEDNDEQRSVVAFDPEDSKTKMKTISQLRKFEVILGRDLQHVNWHGFILIAALILSLLYGVKLSGQTYLVFKVYWNPNDLWAWFYLMLNLILNIIAEPFSQSGWGEAFMRFFKKSCKCADRRRRTDSFSRIRDEEEMLMARVFNATHVHAEWMVTMLPTVYWSYYWMLARNVTFLEDEASYFDKQLHYRVAWISVYLWFVSKVVADMTNNLAAKCFTWLTTILGVNDDDDDHPGVSFMMTRDSGGDEKKTLSYKRPSPMRKIPGWMSSYLAMLCGPVAISAFSQGLRLMHATESD